MKRPSKFVTSPIWHNNFNTQHKDANTTTGIPIQPAFATFKYNKPPAKATWPSYTMTSQPQEVVHVFDEVESADNQSLYQAIDRLK